MTDREILQAAQGGITSAANKNGNPAKARALEGSRG